MRLPARLSLMKEIATNDFLFGDGWQNTVSRFEASILCLPKSEPKRIIKAFSLCGWLFFAISFRELLNQNEIEA
jgi:hypothetical protein